LASTSPDKQQSQRAVPDASSSSHQPQSKSVRQDSSDNLKSFKVSLDDPTWKVLPAALKKYRINNDNWQNYAMFICYGSPGNRIERCLSYDEKPLLLFQKLKDARKNPVFMLKHIKDIRSPIAVAQQKHAARKASSTISSSDISNPSRTTASRTNRPPPKLEVNDFSSASTTQPMNSGSSLQAGWPEVLSPAAEQKDRVADALVNGAGRGHESVNSALTGTTLGADLNKSQSRSSDAGETTARENPVAMSDVSYAVAIYPYMAEQDDEFDVVVCVN
jgi:hypothetical protein